MDQQFDWEGAIDVEIRYTPFSRLTNRTCVLVERCQENAFDRQKQEFWPV